MSLFYDIEGETPICPCCGNHVGYGIMIDGVCEECYINRQNQFEPDYPEPEFENEDEKNEQSPDVQTTAVWRRCYGFDGDN